MSRKVTPEYLAGWVDACGTVELLKESVMQPELRITITSRRTKVIEASANVMRIGDYRRVPMGRDYIYEWTIEELDDLVKLCTKLQNHVVIFYELFEAVLSFHERQQAYDELLQNDRKEYIPNTVARALQARTLAAKELIRVVKSF